uniref:Uncharacterized protein n=1 Tax=Sus scrofa TaxID=9823 RepID=A0A8D1SHH6_PIG
MTTSWRLKRRSTAARRAPRKAFSRAESPYTVASSAPSTAASSTTYTARPSAARARRSSSARRLLPVYGSPQNTTRGIVPGRGHVQLHRQLPGCPSFRRKTEIQTALPRKTNCPQILLKTLPRNSPISSG